VWAEIVVLRLIGTLARVAFGFALASLAAGLVTVLFVNTPAEVLAQPADRLPQTAGETFELALLTATHSAVFAFTFALILALLGEWFSLRTLSFYLVAGMVIAALGFFAQYESEVPGEPTILNNYALKAFLMTGFVSGFIYWLAAGQFAGNPPMGASTPGVTPDHAGGSTEQKSARRDAETSVDITHPITVAQSTTHGRSLLHRLTLTKARPAEAQAEAETEPENEKRDDDADGDAS
jgi:hypothetical protein